MSHEASIKKVYKVQSHPNAQNLDLVTLEGESGFQSVIGKDSFKSGDLVLFIEPDSVLPDELKDKLQQTMKIKLDNRIRSLRIRGCISEGLCIEPSVFLPPPRIKEGEDVSELLGVTHYEPPAGPNSAGGVRSVNGANPWYSNKNFREYIHIERLQKHPNVIQVGETVSVTVKRHGMNARYGWVPKPDPTTWWQKLLRKLGVNPFQYLVGSHRTVRNIGRKACPLPPEMANKDAFISCGERLNLRKATQEISREFGNVAVIIYAELVGWGGEKPIQAGYWYGLPKGECEIRVFDIMVNGKFLAMLDVRRLCSKYNLPMVEEVYSGPFSLELLTLAEQIDTAGNWTGNREGVVIKPQPPRFDPHVGYCVFKVINSKYLLDKANTEYH